MSTPISVSFEFFPPKTEEMERTLWESVERLAPLQPHFVSVTYGAGGTTRERTHATVERIARETALLPAAHLTCVAASRDEISHIVEEYWRAGVRHIVALRGDAIAGPGARYEPHPEGFAYTHELVGALASRGFDVSVSAYPERHPDSPDWDSEIDLLKKKRDAGASRAITQFFFDNALYFRYVERVRKAGIDIPIVPGILPVQNFAQVANFAKRCGTSVPEKLARRFEGLEHDQQTRALVAAAVCAEQVENLQACGINDFHFYTMNRANLVYAICHLLGLRPQALREAA